jgi:hypothetical protein
MLAFLENKSKGKVFLLIFVIIIYFIYGTFIYMRIEDMSVLKSFGISVVNNFPVMPLTYIFEDIQPVPKTVLGKLFTILYGLSGIFLVGVNYDYITSQFFLWEEEAIKSTKISINRENSYLFKFFFIFVSYIVLFTISVSVLIIFEQWTFIDSLFYVWVVSTYLGSIEVYPKQIVTMSLISVLMLLSNALFIFTISSFIDYFLTKNQNNAFNETLNQKYTTITFEGF